MDIYIYGFCAAYRKYLSPFWPFSWNWICFVLKIMDDRKKKKKKSIQSMSYLPSVFCLIVWDWSIWSFWYWRKCDYSIPCYHSQALIRINRACFWLDEIACWWININSSLEVVSYDINSCISYPYAYLPKISFETCLVHGSWFQLLVASTMIMLESASLIDNVQKLCWANLSANIWLIYYFVLHLHMWSRFNVAMLSLKRK